MMTVAGRSSVKLGENGEQQPGSTSSIKWWFASFLALFDQIVSINTKNMLKCFEHFWKYSSILINFNHLEVTFSITKGVFDCKQSQNFLFLLQNLEGTMKYYILTVLTDQFSSTERVFDCKQSKNFLILLQNLEGNMKFHILSVLNGKYQ